MLTVLLWLVGIPLLLILLGSLALLMLWAIFELILSLFRRKD